MTVEELPWKNPPWYYQVDDENLEQGDILFQIPVLRPNSELKFPLEDNDQNTLVGFERRDIVILTQTCDLANDKLQDVLLCPHYALSDIPAFQSKKDQEELAKGRRHRYLLLESSSVDAAAMTRRVVDFGQVVTMPKNYVLSCAISHSARLRLCSPYREHLAVGYANFVSRVALPRNLTF